MSKTNTGPVASGSYPFKEIEARWQEYWKDNNLHKTDLSNSEKKLYSLVMFSYPSGEKLHIGHWYNFGPADTWSRKKKMEGYNIFEPMGFDSFGLPAENYAVKTGINPVISTGENIDIIRKQLREIGAMYDWSRELATSDPEYYKWTQWLFLKFFERGMAVRKEAPVNWCPSCKTVLANEQVIDGRCERCESQVTRRNLKQWFLKITEYADRLLAGHDKLDWPDKTVGMQRNWIGRSEGSEIIFTEEKTGEKIPVFTTRADTLFGVTYLVLAPEHPLVECFTAPEQKKGVRAYIEQSRSLSEIERLSTTKEKTGIFTGSFCINPINGSRVPIWIADYVLLSYGTGAVMAVPGHDQRDWEFANKFDLEITQVIKPSGDTGADLDSGAFVDYGVMVNSGEFDDLSSDDGAKSITEKLQRTGAGNFKVTFKLRDWLISRQRYWGTPIPIIHCHKCGDVAVPEEDLPVLLPQIEDFKPADEGKSPLAKVSEFLNTKCPKCGGEAERETDTMDTFVDSSWYFLRYIDPAYEKGPWNPELVERWLPVDMYIGGAEHAVMHLMYARFFCMFLHDIGLLAFEEPFPKLRHQGMITNRGAKISKSRGNVINPEHILDSYGSNTLRIYLMFMGSYEHGGDWDDSGINGVARFLARVYRLILQNADEIKNRISSSYSDLTDKDAALNYRLNLTIKRVTDDIDSLEFNTAVSALMELLNDLYKAHDDDNKPSGELFYFSMKQLILMLAPMAPHLAEELWQIVGGKPSIFEQKWPSYDQSALQLDSITMVVQINGKLRGSFMVPKDVNEDDFTNMAIHDERISRHLHDKRILKKIFIPGRLLNIVAK